MVKNRSGMQDTWIQSLTWEDPLEKGMATHSSILTWEIPWTEKPVGLQTMGSQELDMTEPLQFHFHFFILCVLHTNIN